MSMKQNSLLNEVSAIAAEHAAGQKEVKRKTEDEMKPWLEKYKIWQKISKD